MDGSPELQPKSINRFTCNHVAVFSVGGPVKIRKAVTAAKAVANKKNAEKSTGPRSPQGTFFASKNAIRHGVLTRDLLLPRSLSGESEEELEQLRRELIADYGA